MKSRTALLLFGATFLLCACAKLPRQAPPWAPPSPTMVSPQPLSRGVSSEIELGQPEEEKRKPDLHRGHGRFVKSPDSVRRPPSRQGEYTLNFEDADLHEVVKVILGDLLQENYVIDPAVTGTVNIQSSHPLSREDLIPILESLLKINDAVLVESGGLFKIIPAENAFRESLPPSVGQRPGGSPLGFRTQVVPLRYIGVDEVQKLLEPFLTEVLIQADKRRNLLILAGPQRLLDNMIETIEVFDVDWLKGMSLGLIPLEYADAKTVVTELDAVFGGEDESTLGGMARFIPIERLNSVLIVTSQAKYLDEISGWMGRLDRSDGKAGQRLHVYYVQNGKASDLAATLNGVFGTGPSQGAFPGAEVAPGLEPATIESEEPQEEGQRRGAAEQQPVSASELTLPSGSTVRIIPDVVNNALVVFSSAADYQMIESALKKLDIIPLQVLIEASIIEVTLTDNLRYGVEWFFRNKIGGEAVGTGFLDLGPAAGLGAVFPGFSYLITTGSEVRAALNMLEEETDLKVLSSPSLMVLDNNTASINVGDQVPVRTGLQQAVTDVTAPLLSSGIEYRDTGVILEVTPRVNASGLVSMDLSQEVTDLGPVDPNLGPTFFKREVKSAVAVQSGDTIVLGGLIDESDRKTNSGIPGLSRLPVIGGLFGTRTNNVTRQELLVVITPRAVRNQQESLRVTEEFKRKLERIVPPRADLPTYPTPGR
ncbi:MAG: type II secretion system secretin GspD [Gammaproteobacteria bacterium]